MRTALLVLLLLIAAVSWAGTDTRASVSSDPTSDAGHSRSAPPGDVVAFWSQIQNFDGQFQAYSSEEKPVFGYWCLGADDFYSENGDTIVKVDWWGHERDLPVERVPEFAIRFYENDSTTRYDFPGAMVHEEHVFDFTAEFIGNVEKYYYSCDLPVGFGPNPGETYWLSIVAVHPSPAANQQWYWYDCIPEDRWGAEATIKSDFWGIPEWIPYSSRPYGNYVEHAFILYSRSSTPVEGSSWTTIKAMYR